MKARIAAIEYALPKNCVTNEDLDRAHPEWSMDRVAVRTGVIKRYHCADDETALDLSITACEQLFDREEVAREDVGAIIVCTQSPDHIMPPNSTILQHRLGLPTTAAAFDFTLACSGFIYGLMMGKAMIESGAMNNIIIVTSEAYSKLIHPDDRATMALFGDGAAATLLRGDSVGLGEFELGSDGGGADKFIVPAGGSRTPKSLETALEMTDTSGNIRSAENIYMDGAAVLRFVKREVPPNVTKLLEKTGYSYDDIDLFVFHQASGMSLDHLEATLKIPPKKMYRNLERVGNTVSASIPIAIRDAQSEGLVVPGSRLLLSGFGVGYSWGACIVDW